MQNVLRSNILKNLYNNSIILRYLPIYYNTIVNFE